MVKNNVFKELIEKYPTWDVMHPYLESQFKISDMKGDFCIVRCEKGSKTNKWFRSVVWDMKRNIPLCMAPPKASDGYPESLDGIVCQELMDGFMINCFKVDKTLHITSRSKLDASGTFYSDRTFRDLFIEAYTDTFNLPCNENAIQDNFDSSVFYSFLVQHKEHRIVKKIDKNCVFLIHKGTVYDDGSIEFEDSPPFKTCIEVFPNTFNMSEMPWELQLVLKDSLGNRWRFRSDKYAAVRALRGNSANIRDRFAQLYTQNLLFKYLEYYPEEFVQINMHLMLLHNTINVLYKHYIDLHVKHIKTDINKKFLPHLYNIHGIYLNTRRKITVNEIATYFQKLPWQRVAFLF